MTPDRIVGGFVDAQIEGGRRVRAKIVFGRIILLDSRNREVKPAKNVKVPEGTIESLRPLLQEAFGLFGEDQGDGYWEKLAQDAPFVPNEACSKLRGAGISHTEAASLLLASEPRVQEALTFQHINDNNLQAFTSLVSAAVLREYNRK